MPKSRSPYPAEFRQQMVELCSYTPNIGKGATVYAYETQAAYQDNTRVEQLTPEQIQRMNEERERNKGLKVLCRSIRSTMIFTDQEYLA